MSATTKADLGRDFWLYRFGQIISVIGDSCGIIALSWWILDKTGSATQMSAVIAPAMFIRIILLPLFGPIGDKFNRKLLIFLSDVWRFVFFFGLAAMVNFDYYNVYLIMTLYVLIAFGSALFGSVSESIIPQLVKKEQLSIAIQQSQAINAVGSIIGGIAGGFLVTLIGMTGAFTVNALSFLASATAVLFIKAKTAPEPKESTGNPPLKDWFNDLKDGFKYLYKIKVLFWIGIVSMFLNFFLSPMGIILPYLAKESRNMPPWFLGALESSVSAGAIIGAVSVGFLTKRFLKSNLVVFGILLIGAGVFFMPILPNAAIPLSLMFIIGTGAAITNINISTQRTIATPDSYRSRADSMLGFMCQAVAPLSVALAGIGIETIGLAKMLYIAGGCVMLGAPTLYFIPKFSLFMNSDQEDTGKFFNKHYKTT